MTLDEAIKHAEEVAEEKQHKAHNLRQCKDYGNPKSTITSGVGKCETCADEHRQLAEWLKDYKRLLEQPTCDDCVSRAEVDKLIYLYLKTPTVDDSIAFYEHFLDLPPVTPTRCIAEVKFSKDDLREICNERIEIECTKLKAFSNELKVRMKSRDEDNGGEPLNAVDRGYHLAFEHLCEEIDSLLTKYEKRGNEE